MSTDYQACLTLTIPPGVYKSYQIGHRQCDLDHIEILRVLFERLFEKSYQNRSRSDTQKSYEKMKKLLSSNNFHEILRTRLRQGRKVIVSQALLRNPTPSKPSKSKKCCPATCFAFIKVVVMQHFPRWSYGRTNMDSNACTKSGSYKENSH